MNVTIISSLTFLVALLVSYFSANAIFEAANEKYLILEKFRTKLIKSKNKNLIKRYYLFAAFALYIIFSGLLNFNDLENGVFLGAWASFVILVYKPMKAITK